MNNLISVIIPVYNLEAYLEASLQSVLNQTHKNLEIIIINDGSTDNSAKIIDKLAAADKRIVAIHKPNGGVTSARNAGIAAATGEYIAFFDGDDFAEPKLYERLLTNLKKYDTDISHCGYVMDLPSKSIYYYNTGELIVQNGYEGLFAILDGLKVEPGMWNKLYKAEIVKPIFIDPIFRTYEDFLFNVYAFEKAQKCVYEDLPLYHYKVRANSGATSQISKRRLENFITIAQMLPKHFANNPEVLPQALKKAVNMQLHTLDDLITIKNPEFKPLIPSVRSFIRANKGNAPLTRQFKLRADFAASSLTLYKLLLFLISLAKKVRNKPTFEDDLKKMREQK
ncbi:MAG: glycosyltransferase [Oscillospiraceae bacterium]|jgi:glycosyltransferase involved in cell wall biosynthesis|nr:glycosyltransferase [Oscillospiraceae bacterium]